MVKTCYLFYLINLNTAWKGIWKTTNCANEITDMEIRVD
jgi:hypothetical protein